MAAGGKAAELRAGIVVLAGLVVLAAGLFFVSGGEQAFVGKSRLKILFKDAGGIGNGADVYVAGRKAGEVVLIDDVQATEIKTQPAEAKLRAAFYVAITVEVNRTIAIPRDSVFRISRSITNVINMHIERGEDATPADSSMELWGERLETFEELVDSSKDLLGAATKTAEDVDLLVNEARQKVQEVDVTGIQKRVDEVLVAYRDVAAEARDLIRGNRERIDGTLESLRETTAALRADWAEMSPKVHAILDDTRVVAGEVKGAVQENRPGIKSVVEQLDDGIRRLAPLLARAESIGHKLDDTVADLRPEIRRGLVSATKALENFQALTEDLRTAPWKLLNKPSDRESDLVHLYNAARLYVDAAGRLALAVEDLDGLRRTGALEDPERTELVERAVEGMREALASFESSQKRFTDLISATAEEPGK